MHVRKQLQGIVVSNKMNKTVVVMVFKTGRHPQFGKVIRRRKKYYAHVDNVNLRVGDTVKIMETRPISKLKRWLVVV